MPPYAGGWGGWGGWDGWEAGARGGSSPSALIVSSSAVEHRHTVLDILGAYEDCGAFHGQRCYRRAAGGAYLYHWQDEGASVSGGWWFGVEPGGAECFASCEAPGVGGLPPRTGWRVPWNSPRVEPGLLLVLPAEESEGSGARARGALLRPTRGQAPHEAPAAPLPKSAGAVKRPAPAWDAGQEPAAEPGWDSWGGAHSSGGGSDGAPRRAAKKNKVDGPDEKPAWTLAPDGQLRYSEITPRTIEAWELQYDHSEEEKGVIAKRKENEADKAARMRAEGERAKTRREEEETKRLELRATMGVRKAIMKMKTANESNCEKLFEELKDAYAAQVDKMGSQAEVMALEADKVLIETGERLDRMFIWTPAVPGAIDLMSSEAESLRAITKEEERLAKEAEALAEEASRLEAMSVEEWGAAQPEADDAGPPEGGEAGGCWGSVPPPPIAQLRSEDASRRQEFAAALAIRKVLTAMRGATENTWAEAASELDQAYGFHANDLGSLGPKIEEEIARAKAELNARLGFEAVF